MAETKGSRAGKSKDDFSLYGVIMDDGGEIEFRTVSILADPGKQEMARIYRQLERGEAGQRVTKIGPNVAEIMGRLDS